MQIDKVTLYDLSIFNHEEASSVFHHFNYTRTAGGREWLRRIFLSPHTEISQIVATQQLLKRIIEKEEEWPAQITNGTVIMIHKFFDTAIDDVPKSPNPIQTMTYRFLHGPDYSLIKFSIPHFIDFFQGMHQLLGIINGNDELPRTLKSAVDRANALMERVSIKKIIQKNRKEVLSDRELLQWAHFFYYHYKTHSIELIEIYARLDAYFSMAVAAKKHSLFFPSFVDQEDPLLKIDGLYHPLLPTPVAYDARLDGQHNFLFLTGANMAGKSTFIKSVGIAVFLAHIGMGVPARFMQLSLFSGLLSNIQVMDNIMKGESYFFNEVQRIKNTILTINDSRKWLILIDELFKGTNVQDAMKCSLTVIQGLIRIRHSLFILSTHLYEIGEELKVNPNIIFRYFETRVADDQLVFSYQLKEGVSNDRLGYLILKREKVVDLLNQLQ